jgi:hypothetical protein
MALIAVPLRFRGSGMLCDHRVRLYGPGGEHNVSIHAPRVGNKQIAEKPRSLLAWSLSGAIIVN